MKFTLSTLAVAALATSVAADGWFGAPHRLAYNKWHETELERWLDDYSIPHPKAAARKDLEDLVKKNWDNNVVKPYNSWDVKQLTNFLTSKGYEAKKGTEKNTKSLIEQVQGYWTSTEAQAEEAYSNVQSWVFNSWTDSQLKSFLDYHHIPNPAPRNRDSLLSTVRSNYATIANKAGETASYPGDWLYTSWSDSDLKSWLDQRGVPVPQPGNRDKLIASIRRNAYLASNQASNTYASASASAAGAQQSLSDALLESWSDSQIKEWADKNGIKVPQGSKRNELIALARKHSASLTGNNVASSASSAYGAATSKVAGNFYPQQTNALYGQARSFYDYALNQIGFASAEAKASLSSASVEAAKTASLASRSGSSASSVASKSSSSAASVAGKSASSASKQGSSSASVASKSGSSAASVASKSGSSAASVASKSAASAASVASKSAASAASAASASVGSAGKQASKSAKSAASVVSGTYEKATDRVKQEL